MNRLEEVENAILNGFRNVLARRKHEAELGNVVEFINRYYEKYHDPVQDMGHPLTIIRYVDQLLNVSPSAVDVQKLTSALGKYNSLWRTVPQPEQEKWMWEIYRHQPIIEKIQKKLSDWTTGTAMAAGVTGLEWRMRLAKWREDRAILADTLQMIRDTEHAAESSQCVQFLYRGDQSPKEREWTTSAVRNALIERFFKSLRKKPAENETLWEIKMTENIRLLALQSHYERDHAAVDKSIINYLERGVLPMNYASLRLLHRMYGKGRAEVQPGGSLPTMVSNGNKGFDEYFIYQERTQFVALPAEQLQAFRTKLFGKIIETFYQHPERVTPYHAELLRELVEVLSPKDYSFKERIQGTLRQYMDNIRIPAESRCEVYNKIGDILWPKTHEQIWKGGLERLRLLERIPVPEFEDEKQVVAYATRKIGAARMAEMLREPSDVELLPKTAKMILAKYIDYETMEAINPTMETPIVHLQRMLVTQLVNGGENIQLKNWDLNGIAEVGRSRQEWAEHLDRLPDWSGLTAKERAEKCMEIRRRDIDKLRVENFYRNHPPNYAIMLLQLDAGLKDHDAFVFRQVPRIRGVTGQAYFGTLLEELSERSVARPQHYTPYVQEVLPFLSRDELVQRLEGPRMQSATEQNPVLAKVLAQHLRERLGSSERLIGSSQMLQDQKLSTHLQMLQERAGTAKDIGHQVPKGHGQETPAPAKEVEAPGRDAYVSYPSVIRPNPGGLGR